MVMAQLGGKLSADTWPSSEDSLTGMVLGIAGLMRSRRGRPPTNGAVVLMSF
jgi:hypothetical protein